MKVLLVHAPIFFSRRSRSALEHVSNAAPPLGLAYLAGMVESEADVEIIDAQGMSEEMVKEKVRRTPASVVGVSSSTVSIRNAARIAGWVKEVQPDCTTVVGGPHVTAAPLETMEVFPVFDFGVAGDGEVIFRDLVRAVGEGKDRRSVPGVMYRDSGSGVKANPPPPPIPLDEIPFPAWHLLPPFDFYRFNPSAYRRHPHAMVIASRGCPYQCIFCHAGRFRQVLQYRSPRNIVDEIESLVRTYGIREVKFGDELFAVNTSWVGKICEELRQRKLDVIWACEARANTMTPEFARLLKSGGCWQVTIGIESGSPRILDRIKKKITREQVKNTVRWAHEAGLAVRAFFMLGFPFEDREDMLQTIEFAVESGVDDASFGFVVPFPGTELYELCEELGYFGKNGWLEFDSVLNRPGCPPKGIAEDEMMALLKKAYHRFFLRPAYVARTIRQIQTWEDVRRLWRGARAVLSLKGKAS
ncbi:MAG: B12-binding domain-containing radical SAM protein [Candidatus Aminicenantes bacterium]|nr:B12-binding domain-containing radical SAM protein [Candidatus Aminicenantes bacterium]